MKTIVVDKYKGKVLQSISYEDGLVVINRKRVPEFLFWGILFPIVLLMMVMAFCVIICSIQDSIFGDYPIFEKCMLFLMGVFFLLCTTPLFMACTFFNSRIFQFQASIKRDRGKLIYHLKNGFINHKKNFTAASFRGNHHKQIARRRRLSRLCGRRQNRFLSPSANNAFDCFLLSVFDKKESRRFGKNRDVVPWHGLPYQRLAAMKKRRLHSGKSAREAMRATWLAPLIVAAGGCVLIPTGTDTASTEVIGKRTDADGRVCEKIIRYDKHLNFQYFGITPEGLYGAHYFSYSRYAAITGEGESPIWAMEHFPSLAWTDVKTAVPIPDSDRWITFERSGCTIDEYDICLIIFSVKEGKILRHRFEHVRRYAPPGVPSVIGGFWIEGRDDLRYLLVHETDKITRVDTVTGDMTVEEEPSP